MTTRSLYSQPLRVYLILAAAAAVGLVLGFGLPVSLFPNSSKPTVGVWVGYGGATAEDFRQTYGNAFEQALETATGKGLVIERIRSTYRDAGVEYGIDFGWGSDPEAARREVEIVANANKGRFPQDAADSVEVWMNNENSGFYAASFYSDTRGLDELYGLIEPALTGPLAAVADASQPEIWNPERKEIRIELRPEAMAGLGLVPRDVEGAVKNSLRTRAGGSVRQGVNDLLVELPRQAKTPDELGGVPLSTPSGRIVHLSDVAAIDFGTKTTGTRIIKTSGAPSILVYAQPKAGGNIKRMAEDIQAAIDAAMLRLPPDVHFRVLVDPSQFIRSAVSNVVKEVALGALLAVLVLFVFIGSLRNVVTAAVEIPLSIVLAFILMRITGVNINLISLGGLALSAGMNVDGSVVVMENIFRHFGELRGRALTAAERLALLVRAVAEVKLPLVASTLASLIVFVPLMLTRGLSNAILGDLAKAVVFSHGFSAVVALILVPTVRYQLMGRGTAPVADHHSPAEPLLRRLDAFYSRMLRRFLGRPALKWAAFAALTAVLAALIFGVLPTLPREVIGTPDSDLILVRMNASGNTLVRQMEAQSDEVERRLLTDFGAELQYTFTQINTNRSTIFAKLTRKDHMERVWHALEAAFPNTPELKIAIEPFNPSELPIPDPPTLRVAVRGGDVVRRRDAALELSDLLEAGESFARVGTDPSIERRFGLSLAASPEQWAMLRATAAGLAPSDVVDIARVANDGRWLGVLTVGNRETDIVMRYPAQLAGTPEDLAALPVGIAGKIVPFGALLPFTVNERPPSVYRENHQDLIVVSGRVAATAKAGERAARDKATAAVAQWQAKHQSDQAAGAPPSISVEDAGKDVTEAINQLGLAILSSIALIFLVLVLQFGTIVEALLVLIAVPLGFIGVVVALKVSGSTLSLNSALGVILLNGIAVNNSIIMVDFIRRLHAEGHAPRDAAAIAAHKRLRPILITSLTTVLGMLPIALGLGEGGRILQPLGIAVSGGLGISMILTLFLVPALQVSYLEARDRRAARRTAGEAPKLGGAQAMSGAGT